jgi:hypothetical protein
MGKEDGNAAQKTRLLSHSQAVGKPGIEFKQ